jgi:hypothetical protein
MGRRSRVLLGMVGVLDVHFVSSLPVMQRLVCTVWVEKKPVQIAGAVC